MKGSSTSVRDYSTYRTSIKGKHGVGRGDGGVLVCVLGGERNGPPTKRQGLCQL